MQSKLLLLSALYDEVCIDGDINKCYTTVIKEYPELENCLTNGVQTLFEIEVAKQKEKEELKRNLSVLLLLNGLKNKLINKQDINDTYYCLIKESEIFKENIKDILKSILQIEIENCGGDLKEEYKQYLHPELKEILYGKDQKAR